MVSPHVPALDSLELLAQVASTGSLGRAAAAHGISQPAVSARIRGMEAQVGFALIQRSARGSTLTPAGALLTDWARDVLGAAEVMDAGISSLRAGRAARLQVAASMTVAEHLLAHPGRKELIYKTAVRDLARAQRALCRGRRAPIRNRTVRGEQQP